MLNRFTAALVCALFAVAVDVAVLLDLYDVVTLPDALDGDATHDLASLIKVGLLAVLCRDPSAARLFRALALLAVGLALSLFVATFGLDILHWVVERALTVLLWVLVAACWLYVSTLLSRLGDEEPFRGYRDPFRVATLLIGLAMLAYFFDTPRLLGHVLFDVSLAGWSAASISPIWNLSGGRRFVLYTVTLTIPVLIYLAPVFYGVGATLYENRERLATVGAESAEVVDASSWEDLIDTELSGYERTRHTPIFNDVWLFADGRALAVTNGTLHERAAEDSEWSAVRELSFSYGAEYLHFDRAGQRGVLGAGFENPLRSVDGGRSWTTVETEDIFEELRGREFGEGLLDDSSIVYLDPQTGRGSFMMGCRFFTTTDFAETWDMIELVDVEGDTKCPDDTPFAVDVELGIARAAVLGSEYLLHKETPGSPWSVLCAIDFESFLVVGKAPGCNDEGVLSPERAAFVALEAREDEIVSRRFEESMLDELFQGTPFEELAHVTTLRDNGKTTWISGPGLLLRRNDSGAFVADYRVPRLTTIAAKDDRRALGIAGSVVYVTDDGGRIWSRLSDPSEPYLSFVLHVPETGDAYLAGENALWTWRGDGLREMLPRPEEFDVRTARSSPDGMRVALADDTQMLYASDGGNTWRVLEIPYPPETVDEYGDAWRADLVTLDCAMTEGGRCAAVFDSGAALSWSINAPGAATPLPNVLTEDGYAYGFLALLGERPEYVYLPSETSQLHRLEDDSWSASRLGIVFEGTDLHGVRGDRRMVALQLAEGRVLFVDEAGTHHLFDQEAWREWSEDSGQLRLCWSGMDERALLTSSDARLAISSDHGASWRQAQGDNTLGSACGVQDDWLWLMGEGMSVYRRNP